MLGDLSSEGAQRTVDEADDAIRVPAGAAAVDLPQPAAELLRMEVRADGEPLQRSSDGGQAEHAGSTLTRRLAGQVASDSGGLDKPTCLCR
jgi:hypothetical protein